MITNLRDLARHLGVDPVTTHENDEGQRSLVKRIGRAIYKGTECGCTFDSCLESVTIAGYAEGADAECESFQFNYPFEGEAFDEQLSLCDDEGVEMWNEWNGDEADDNLADDNNQRAADLNATLRDIGGGL